MRHDPKQEPTPAALESLRAEIWKMPYLDRASLLVLSVIEHDREAYFFTDGLIKLIAGPLSSGYSASDRLRVSEALRNTADVLDHEPEYVGLKG
jgi:hypothetical protein